MNVRPTERGRVIGLGLGQFRFVGSGVALVALGAGTVLLCAPGALAGPEGATVVAGSASIKTNGANTVIRAGDRTIIDYTKFDINKGESVRFVQPGANARVLNRINSESPTRIDGSLSSNGIVYFVNRAGVMFGQGSVINVGGIYAAAGNISNADFLKGVNRFTDVNGSVTNAGRIDARVAAMVGKTVGNSGTISTPDGMIAMVAGDQVLLTERGGTMTVRVDAPASGASQVAGFAVENTGTLDASGGRSLMVAGDMYSMAVRNTGTIKARRIDLQGRGSGTVEVSGTLDASNQVRTSGGTRGGIINITGQTVSVRGATIDATGENGGGTIRVGGDYQGGSGAGQLARAKNTTVDSASSIDASATGSGNGGTIIVWADQSTGFYGKARADGGPIAGDGGLIETSGKLTLDVRAASVSARSSTGGKAGLWLMDPTDVTIADNSGANSNVNTNTSGTSSTLDPSGSPAIVDVATLKAALDMGTSVTILTGSVGTDDGNITLDAALNVASASAPQTPTLTLRAANDVTINQAITATSGRLNVDLQANSAGMGNTDPVPNQGVVAVNAAITTGGGTFRSSGVNFANTAAGVVNTAGGNITLEHTGAVSLAGELNAGATSAATVSITGTGFSVSGTGAVVGGTGGITLAPVDTTNATTINVGGTGGFELAQATLQALSTTGTLTIGASGGANVISVGAGGAVDLSGRAYDLRLRGGDLSFDNALTLGSGKTLSIVAANVSNPFATAGVTIGGVNGGVTIDASGDVNLKTAVAVVAARSSGGVVNIANTGALNVGTIGSIAGVSGGTDKNVTITSTGALSVSSAVAALGTGNVLLQSTGGNAGDVTVAAAVTSAAGTITTRADNDVRFSAGGSVASTGGGTVTIAADNDSTNASGPGTGGAVSFASGTTASSAMGAVNVTASGNITGATGTEATLSGSTLSLTSAAGTVGTSSLGLRTQAGTVTASGPQGVNIQSLADTQAQLTATSGAVKITSTGTLATSGAWTGTTVDASSTGDMTLTSDVTGTDGFVSLSSLGTLNVGATRTVSAGGTAGYIFLTVGDLVLDGSLAGGTRDVFINRADVNATNTIGLGDATGDLSISKAELGRITARQLTIGGPNTKTLTVTNVAQSDVGGVSGLTVLRALGSDGAVIFTGGDSSFGSLQARANGRIEVNSNLSATLGDLSLASNANQSIDTGGDNIRIGAGVTISTLPTGGSITLDAGGLGIAGAGATTITATQALNLNSSITSVGPLTLSGGSGVVLGGTSPVTISANDGVTISSDLSGSTNDTTINADADADGMGTFTLLGGRRISTGNRSLTVLAADADIQGDIAAGTGTVQIGRSTAGTVGVGNASGDMTLSGTELARIAAGELRIGSANTSTVIADALSGTDLAGITARLTFVGDDVNIAGAINTGAVALSILRGSAGAITLGNATGGLNISNDELARITAPSLTIGDTTTTSMVVNGVSASDFAGVTGAINLNTGGTLTFGGTPSSFTNLTASAVNGINVNANLSTTVGDLTLDGDSNNAANGFDQVSIFAGRSVSAAGRLSLKAQTQGIVGVGSMTLSGGSGVDILSSLSTAGATTINADSNADGTGSLLVQGGRTISTAGNALTLIAADLTLDGSINAGAGSVSINRGNNGTIGLGTATGDLALSGAEMGRIIATGLTIGGTNITSIVVTDVSAVNSNGIAGTVTLNAGAPTGTIAFSGRSTFNALDARATSGLTVASASGTGSVLVTDVGNLRLDGDSDNSGGANDVVTLSAAIGPGTTGDLEFISNVRLAASLSLEGRNVRFSKKIDSDGTARSLTVNTAATGETVFGGDIGSTNRLFTLTTDANGTTKLTGTTRTTGTITFNDAVALTGDALVSAEGGLGVFFNGTIDTDSSSSALRSLTVLTSRTGGPSQTQIPVISFARSIGATRRLNTLRLNYDPSASIDGRTTVPAVATIIFRSRDSSGNIIASPSTTPTFVVRLDGNFRMGQNEKLTAQGNLTINADGVATVGDLSATGNLALRAGSIRVNRRAAGNVVRRGGGLDRDQGVDFVAGGTLSFVNKNGGATLELLGTGSAPRFAARGGEITLPGGDSFINQTSTGIVLTSVNSSGSTIATLDLRATGVSTTSPSTVLVRSEPRPDTSGAPESTGVDSPQAAMALSALGISVRQATPDERAAGLEGTTIFDDLPYRAVPTASDYGTVATRLSPARVQAVLAADREVFGGIADERAQASARIREDLQGSVRRFVDANKVTGEISPMAFRAFLEQSPEEAASLEHVVKLDALVRELEGLGLTARELTVSKRTVLNPLRPRGIRTVDQFEAVLKADTRTVSR